MENILLKIVSFTDPYCTWCWGSEPVLRKIQEVYGNQVDISFVMGGLVKDIRNFSDPGAGIGGEQWYKQVAEHWEDASGRHKMPVDVNIFYDIKDEVFSTYPASIAFKAAQLQSEEKGRHYLRRLREGAAAQRLAIHDFEIQVQLAEETGLDINQFKNDMKNGSAEKAFQQDLQECQLKGVRGFPTFLLQCSGEEILLRGYTSYQKFNNWIQELSKGQLKQKSLQCSFSQIFDFITCYGNVAPMEVATVFDMSLENAQIFLKQMSEKGLISEKKAGNGFLYSVVNDTLQCDSETSQCSF